MAEIINLRSRRKAKARLLKAEVAAANRIKHGRSKSQRQRDEQAVDDAERLLDGHHRQIKPIDDHD